MKPNTPPTSCFGGRRTCKPSMSNLIRTAIHTVKPDNIATFLGKKLNGNYQDEMGNRFNVRIEGTRVQPLHGHGLDQNVRQVRPDPAHRNHGEGHLLFQALPRGRTTQRYSVMKFAPMKKTIYSLGALTGTADRRQSPLPGILSAIDDPSNGIDKLNKITRTVTRRLGLIGDLTFSTRTMKPSSWHWRVASSLSAACKTKPCARCSRNSAAAKCPGSYAVFARTGSSKRRATATSTTSQCLANKSLRWASSSRNS